MNKLHLEVVTPEKVVFIDDVDTVVAPASEGDVGILPGHIPLFTKIRPGEVLIKKANQVFSLAVTGGFLEVLNNNINILADYAVRAEEIEIAQAEEAKKRAEKLMEEKTTEKEYAIIQSELQRALLELKVARKRRKL